MIAVMRRSYNGLPRQKRARTVQRRRPGKRMQLVPSIPIRQISLSHQKRETGSRVVRPAPV